MTEGTRRGEVPLVSVVIPVWRDAAALAATLESLPPQDDVEVVVSAVIGEEAAHGALRTKRPDVSWVFAPRGRAVQMNAGAAAARGRWLLFLHADTHLPSDWIQVLRRADSTPGIVGGAFRLALDSRDWRARLIEAGVRLRVALFGLPYGDQALFFRRDSFETLGGYRDLPLMEDIDIVGRAKRTGRLLHARAAAISSARRWQRDGWLRRSSENLGLAVRFLLGASPARLAQRYHGRHADAVVLMARAPWTGGKSRLRTTLDATAHEELRHALFHDTLDVVSSVSRAHHVVACEPPEACGRMARAAGGSVDVIPQRGTDLGERMLHVFEDVARLGVESIVVIGSDLPDLPADRLREALDLLRANPRQVVLGPAGDGGYYLVGMTRREPAMFQGIDWGTARVVEQTLDAARRHGIPVHLLDAWQDVDDEDGLRRLEATTGPGVAPRTRAWLERIRGSAARRG